MCGGAHGAGFQLSPSEGLSPRVRGSQEHGNATRQGVRSIPACAGEPRIRRTVQEHGEVYPRVCGGAVRVSVELEGMMGLSPRVRGSQAKRTGSGHGLRSIPACAGEPDPVTYRIEPVPVYPRVCGGAWLTFKVATNRTGLSPRVRGSLGTVDNPDAALGSIPACAGEPSPGIRPGRDAKVYPRVCGGARRERRRRT